MEPVSFIHAVSFASLPDLVVQQAQRCLLDLAGVAASGARTELSRIVCNHACKQFGAGEQGARILMDGRRASAAGAAYAGASLIDSFDAHDGHALTKGHSGVAVLPALLAVLDAEQIDVTGQEILTCLVLGYEIAIRAGIALHNSACDYHTSGAWNALACAAVAARLLHLSNAQTREALGIAEYHGPRSQMMRCIDTPTMLKDGSGWGALGGVSAAYLASDGFTGAPAITMEASEQSGLWSDLGMRWRIMEQYFKPYPVCRWAQPAVEAVFDLMRRHDLVAADIHNVEIRTFAAAVRLATVVPASTEAAQYSLPFPVASIIVRGRISANEITGLGLADKDLLDMARRIVVTENPVLTARFPAERFATATMHTHDGRHFESGPTAARGNPDTPLSDHELAAKFRDLSISLGASRQNETQNLISKLSRPDTGGDALLEVLLTSASEVGAAT